MSVDRSQNNIRYPQKRFVPTALVRDSQAFIQSGILECDYVRDVFLVLGSAAAFEYEVVNIQIEHVVVEIAKAQPAEPLSLVLTFAAMSDHDAQRLKLLNLINDFLASLLAFVSPVQLDLPGQFQSLQLLSQAITTIRRYDGRTNQVLLRSRLAKR
ncbi:hypothetical protein FHS05_002417 [Microbacterium endophyticum]|uniref:hypothetical protein n=1 Tax=Microbacterium endophyticum TaxID=1526412 RepID=UPI0013EBA6A2|nr:hypothetical protein [Microbacterium endophyticum]NIK37353.1 hypothetical protein [Microbacterium endophyticum]